MKIAVYEENNKSSKGHSRKEMPFSSIKFGEGSQPFSSKSHNFPSPTQKPERYGPKV
jgi:hypothetical protein